MRTRRKIPGNAASVDDRELINRCKKGEPRAFEQIYEQYHLKIHQTALKFVRDVQVAKDIVQDTFIKIFENITNFDGRSTLYTWFYQIVKNLSMDHLRSHKRRVCAVYEDSHAHGYEVLGIEMHSRIPDPLEALEEREQVERLNTALTGLSSKHRRIVLLRALEGKTYDEMAEQIGCSKGTIMSRLYHARKNLKKRFQPSP